MIILLSIINSISLGYLLFMLFSIITNITINNRKPSLVAILLTLLVIITLILSFIIILFSY